MSWTYTLDELAKSVRGELNAEGSVRFSNVSFDSRTIKPGEVFFALPGSIHDGHQFIEDAMKKGAVAVVVNKECKVPHIKVPDPLVALQQFARWHRKNLAIKVFGITGSCGKTTSKELIKAVLGQKYNVVASPGNFNNEIGCPVSLLQMDETTEWAVIEMGAGKPGDIAELCNIAYPEESAITCIGPAHLERLGSVNQVEEEKGRIAECLPPWGTFYVNTFDAHCISVAERTKANKFYFGREGKVVLRQMIPISQSEIKATIEPFGEVILPICSYLSVTNFLLALAVALKHEIQVESNVLVQAFEKVGRVKVQKLGKWNIIDDSYNANPLSMQSSLEVLSLLASKGDKVAILGDMLELGDYAPYYHFELGKKVGQMGLNALFLYGTYAEEVKKGASLERLENVWIMQSHLEIARKIYESVPGDAWILIKGSRGMKMEKVIEHLSSVVQSHRE